VATKRTRPSPRTGSGGGAPRPRWRWLRNLLTAVLGIGGPIFLLILFIQSQTPRPDPAAPPVALDTTAISTEASVELVGAPDGRWELAEGFLGYRIVEHYPRLRDPVEAAGRTRTVAAELLIADGRLEQAEVTADLRDLDSGAANRDRAAQVRYLEAAEHPVAQFTLAEPVDLDLQPGEPFAVAATGDLSIRAVTRTVTFPLEGRWHGDRVQVIGSLPVRLSDWDVRAPDIAGFVSVEDDAVIELDLWFGRP
jgi:polyisoprenoid-binding protein YceI